ncbi:MAG: hypothetical protein K1X68_01350 [Saprospiraceae bacterium]|nr:hypothetical protein [Saprospiraceae bacterium]HMW39892.1 hypothetical protein [Saprospiraceae bacterium]HMX89143.1 hypothetical protein [Saprospiraceae bacterium]HMZ40796.1 hypothetical protein [Saprospiraceae bacterium]HNA64594.1 hypothetical protein [Saprospiraceae bacterium]
MPSKIHILDQALWDLPEKIGLFLISGVKIYKFSEARAALLKLAEENQIRSRFSLYIIDPTPRLVAYFEK